MKVGFIGARNVTRTIGRHLINAGHTIVVSNSRGPETLGEFVAELGPGAGAGTGAVCVAAPLADANNTNANRKIALRDMPVLGVKKRSVSVIGQYEEPYGS